MTGTPFAIRAHIALVVAYNSNDVGGGRIPAGSAGSGAGGVQARTAQTLLPTVLDEIYGLSLAPAPTPTS
ncbi:hypothetical protein [Catellatospora sichuanensis]|uniref:hypothetical protein n=1 Tax=Catellatospora sichuanensis TaxID=1969805 RepID=UPI001181D7DF|nr:hypothetical protein [Catellatospora sichuanensis]